MPDDVPTDVETVLAQLFAAGQEALEEGNEDTCHQIVESVESVATNKLPAGDRRDRLLHGCARIRELLDDDEITAATEFFRAMDDQLTESE